MQARGRAAKAQRAGHVHDRAPGVPPTAEGKTAGDEPDTARACTSVAAIGVALLSAGLAWRPTVAAAASVVLVAASCVFIT